jgi:hypothetical protein
VRPTLGIQYLEPSRSERSVSVASDSEQARSAERPEGRRPGIPAGEARPTMREEIVDKVKEKIDRN